MYQQLSLHYHVLVYSGGVDACVPYMDSQNAVRSLGFSVKEAWRPWTVDDHVAGYVTEYSAARRFTFLTVKKAGHMVPQYQPLSALRDALEMGGWQAVLSGCTSLLSVRSLR